jgi:hypothetical protein
MSRRRASRRPGTGRSRGAFCHRSIRSKTAGNTVSIDRNASRIAVPEINPKSRMPRNSAMLRM